VFGQDQIAHFRAFGFVVLRGLLDQRETAALTEEVTRSLTAAFGGLGTDTDPDHTGGIRGDYLPLTVDSTPLSQALLADDPRLCQGAADLLGAPVVPTPPIATCFTSNAGWHTDQGPDIGGVKYLAHLQPRTAADGALRVLPGSHDPGYAARLRAYQGADPAAQGFTRLAGAVRRTGNRTGRRDRLRRAPAARLRRVATGASPGRWSTCHGRALPTVPGWPPPVT